MIDEFDNKLLIERLKYSKADTKIHDTYTKERHLMSFFSVKLQYSKIYDRIKL